MTITRRGLVFGSVALALAPSALVRADSIPDGIRFLAFTMSIANLSAHTRRWGFVIYPTTNSGCAYVFDPEVSLAQLMMRARGPRTATQLHAIPRAQFDPLVARAERYPHGENRAMVTLIHPPRRMLAAPLPLVPDAFVPRGSTAERIHRTFRIATLTARRFDLVLEREVITHRDGHEEVTTPAPR